MTQRNAAYDYDVGIPIPGQDPATWPRGTREMIERWSRPGPNGEAPLRLVLLDMSEPPRPWRLRLYDGMTRAIMICLIPVWTVMFFAGLAWDGVRQRITHAY